MPNGYRASFREFFLVSILMPLLFGCGNSDGRMAIDGTVSLKGKPIKEGVIEFVSEAGKSGAIITDGKYAIPADQGLTPGTYKVLITAGDGRTSIDSADGMPGPTGGNIVSKDTIPAEYNTKSKQEVTVKATGPNKFDFPIP